MRAILLLLLPLCVLLYASCERQKTNTQEIAEENEEDILNYIEEENIDAIKHESGLYYTIREEGSGTRPNSSSQVQISYSDYLLDGTVLDQADSTNLQEVNLSQAHPGWRIGIPLIREEGEILLLIPARLWAPRGARSVLVSELKLHRVN